MNFAMIILGAGALLLIATTMGRNGRDDAPFGDQDEGSFLPGERIVPPIPFAPAPIVPDTRFLPTFEGVDPDYFGE